MTETASRPGPDELREQAGAQPYGIVRIAVTPGSEQHLKDLLASRGLFLYPVEVSDEMPAYGIGTVITGTTATSGYRAQVCQGEPAT